MSEKVTIEVEAKDSASSVLEGIGGAGLALGGIFAGVVAAGILASVAALAEFVGVAAEAEEVQTKFNTLVGNSNLADFTDEMYALADGLSTVTRFDDETILSAQGMLSTFGTIGKEIFPDVTRAALDLAEATGQDASSAASTLGRAFADMAGGSLGALRGVAKLTDAQKEMAEKMAKSGDIAGAQQLVIDILGEKFGGLAEKMGGTFSGQMTIFQNRIDNMKEALGAELLPLLTPLISQFADLAEMVIPMLGQAIEQYVLPVITVFGEEFSTLMASLRAGISPIDALKDTLFNLTGLDFDTLFSSIQPGLDAFGSFWTQNGPTIQKIIADVFSKLAVIGQELAAKILPFLVQKFNELGVWFSANGPLIAQTLSVMGDAFVILATQVAAMWQIVQPILDGLISLMMNNMKGIMQVITGDFAGAFETWKQGFAILFTTLQGAFLGFANWVTGWFGTSWAQVTNTWDSNWKMLQSIVSRVWGMVKEAIQSKWREISTFVSGAIQGLVTQFKTATSKFSDIGKNLVSGIQTGITGAWASLESIVSGLVGDLIAAIKKMFGIASPSKVMAGVGENLMAGLAKGMSSGVSIPVNAMMETVPALTSTAGKSGGAGASVARSNNQRVNIYGPVTLKLAGESEFLKVR